MALAYAWGLVLAIYLMGHGLVAVPRKLITNADAGRRLRKLQSQAPIAKEKLMEATDELRTYEEQVQLLQARKSGTARDFQEWIRDLADLTNLPDSRLPSSLPSTAQTIPHVITGRYLAELTRKLQRAIHKQLRYSSEWRNLLASAAEAQAILDAKPSRSLVLPHSGKSLIDPKMRYRLYAQIYPALSYFAAGILSIASIAIVWSELTKTFFPQWSLISLSVAPKSRSIKFFPSQFFACFWITYMSICALYSITVLPIWGNRALVRRTTYPESAAWYAAQVAKLTVPLAYNFLTFLPAEVHRRTVFYKFLGEYVDVTPLGRGFSSFFPVLLLFPVAAALFGWYGKIKAVFGFGELLAEDELEDQWREGRDIIDRELRSMGANASTLGLVASRESSLDIERGNPRASSDLSRQALNNAASSSQRTLGSATNASSSRQPARQPRFTDEDDAGENNGFFADFAHRVKNTLDTVDKPTWLKAPKWASNDGEGEGEGFAWNKVFGGNGKGNGVRL
jgi:LMBR1-like membrane protein